jgi:hypothetical protein
MRVLLYFYQLTESFCAMAALAQQQSSSKAAAK